MGSIGKCFNISTVFQICSELTSTWEILVKIPEDEIIELCLWLTCSSIIFIEIVDYYLEKVLKVGCIHILMGLGENLYEP